MAALFTIAKNWKPPQYPSSGNGKTSWHMHTTEHFSIKGKELPIYTAGVNLQTCQVKTALHKFLSQCFHLCEDLELTKWIYGWTMTAQGTKEDSDLREKRGIVSGEMQCSVSG
jgi:hypothetical protein